VRALTIVHQADAGPGVFGRAIRAAGWGLDSWLPPTQPEPPDLESFDAVLTFGGAMHPDQEDRHPWLATEKALLSRLIDREMPLLAVCLGCELLAEAAGARARRAPEPEIGWREVEVADAGAGDPVIGPLAPRFTAFQWHSYEAPLPPGAAALAQSPVCLQAYRVGERAWGIQFHAEVKPADAERWIDDYGSDPDAVRIGIDPERLRAETRDRISAWNWLGFELCGRFLDTVSRPAASRRRVEGRESGPRRRSAQPP
jgi:GMP synthase (glutamine-hydrolysing)